MIEPVLKGQALLDDIRTAQPQSGEICIWWLGQSGYAIKTTNTLFYIDLYLSEHLTKKYATTDKPHIRMTEAPLRGGDITDANLIFASHKHSDHLDPGTLPDLFAASPNAHLILPTPLVDHAVSMGLPLARLIPTTGDEFFEVGELDVRSIPAAHPTFETTAEGTYLFVGYLIEADGIRLYHSGDTLVYDGLANHLYAFGADILFLPINGTDTRRNELHVPPNMSAAEAVALVKQVGAGTVIPHHYDMFTFNTADVNEFAALATEAGVKYAVLQAGERYTYKKG